MEGHDLLQQVVHKFDFPVFREVNVYWFMGDAPDQLLLGADRQCEGPYLRQGSKTEFQPYGQTSYRASPAI